ncbi:MAG TPA: hypothetical protein PLO37_04670 [Candidatus Hydrogenedentes bacterium]|nr:hypothetical protein [Candidatus Hydrogenedentota bacterium]HPG66119.1 hypothetical protein [Candidatus Hydrogenedentota bacterium]
MCSDGGCGTCANDRRTHTGACVEDVNHEIYGGLYRQMIFGESLQEPPLVAAPKGFEAFEGTWMIEGGQLHASAVETLAAPLDAVITADAPSTVVPNTSEWRYPIESGETTCTLAPRSFTVFTFADS